MTKGTLNVSFRQEAQRRDSIAFKIESDFKIGKSRLARGTNADSTSDICSEEKWSKKTKKHGSSHFLVKAITFTSDEIKNETQLHKQCEMSLSLDEAKRQSISENTENQRDCSLQKSQIKIRLTSSFFRRISKTRVHCKKYF